VRYKLLISYDGKDFLGFQRQKDSNTIQEVLEVAICKVLGRDVTLVASGRTDAGVSAIEQVCHIDVEEQIDKNRFLGYVNSILPITISVIDISEVSDDFHARYSAKKKTYEYLFYTSRNSIPVYDRIASKIGYNLNIEGMKEGCKYIKGTHDFSSFCASNTNVVDKVRTIYDIDIIAIDDNLYKLVVSGNGFLYNMVRIIMGTLIDVGLGKITSDYIIDIVNSKDRSKAGKTAEAKGLYLKKVEY
jgi:tRNA pseudouridine38-40 synthase